MPPRVASLLLASAICALPSIAPAAEAGAPVPQASAPRTESVLARIDGGRHVITAEAFNETLRAGYRQKFYHSQPPEAEYKEFMKETALKMIDAILLPEEAQRRGVTPDNAAVEAQLRQLEVRYGNSPDWAKRREQAFPGLRKEFERQSILNRLEAQVKDLPPPANAQVEAFYKANSALFTEPVRYHVSLILLRVDPSSPEATWQATQKQAEDLRAEILKGASFADLARRHSNDPTADNGGDMGYIHQGQLGEEIQVRLAEAKVSTVLTPVRTLDGLVLLRLDELVPAKLRSFPDVKERATALYQREAIDKAWKTFLSNLRKSGKVEIGSEFRDIVGTEFASR